MAATVIWVCSCWAERGDPRSDCWTLYPFPTLTALAHRDLRPHSTCPCQDGVRWWAGADCPQLPPPSLPLWAGSTENWGFTITCSNSTVSAAPAFHPPWGQQGRPNHRAEAHMGDGHGGGSGVWGFPGSVSRAEKRAEPMPTICTAECLLRDRLPSIGSTPNRDSQPHHQADSRPRHRRGAGGTHRLRSVPGRYWENRECSSGMSLRSHHRFSHRSPGDAGHDEQDSVSWKENRLSASRPQTPSTIGLFPPKQSKDRDRIPWDIHIHWQWNYIS